MIAMWYAIVSLMLIIYVVLDGRNFGAGMLHWMVARTPEERRQVIAAIGPLWSWHEVWLVGFGAHCWQYFHVSWLRLSQATISRFFSFFGA